jgi:hypothetical protein
MTDPALRKSNALNRAWFQTCSKHPLKPRPDQGQPEADEDDADVFDAVVSEQAFQVVLADRERDAQGARNHAQPQDDGAPLGRRVRQQRRDPDDAVDAHLEDDAGQERRDVAGRHRVGAGQPDVQGHHARLQPEPGQREGEDRRRRAGGQRPLPHRGQRERAARRAQQGEEGEQAEGRDVGRHEINPAGLPHLGVVVFRGDQEVGGQRHDLPAEQEQDGVAGDDEQRHAGRQEAVEQAQLPAVVRVLDLLPVAQAVHGT